MTKRQSHPLSQADNQTASGKTTASATAGSAARPACAGCGCELLPSRGPRVRKWCSERCRKAQYAGVCIDCGGPTDGTTPSRGIALHCQSCLSWPDEAIIDAVRRWGEEHGGIPPRREDWRRAAAEHPSSSTVEQRLGWNPTLLAAGFGLHMDRRPETQVWIEKELRAGRPVREIADALGVTESAIHMRVRYRGMRVSELRPEEQAA